LRAARKLWFTLRPATLAQLLDLSAKTGLLLNKTTRL
jgi:hypothetical protein